MRLKGQEINSFLASAEIPVSMVLIYGPDLGLVRERGNLLQAKIVEDAADPFRITNFSASELRQNPSKLADEASTVSMLGGRRVVRVQDGTDAVANIFKSLQSIPFGDTLVILEAGDLPARSSLRKLFENADDGVAVPCYEDEGRTLEAVITETLFARGLSVGGQALHFLSEALGTDRMATRSELEKLALYMLDAERTGEDKAKEVTLEDAQAAIGDRGSMALDTLINAVASGEAARMNEGLQIAYTGGLQPVQVLRGLIRHFGRLQLCGAEMAGGKGPDQAMAALRPPVFFKHQTSFRAQLRRWSPRRVNTALTLLMEAELHCKTTGLPDKTICSRACLRLAVMGQA